MFNSLRPGDIYASKIWIIISQAMTCHLFGAETLLVNQAWQLGCLLSQNSVKFWLQNNFFCVYASKNVVCKVLAILFMPQYVSKLMTLYPTVVFPLQVPLSAVITRSNIVRYYINDYRNWDRTLISCWIHKRHPIPRPKRRAMGCLLWIFVRKLTTL